MKTISIEKINKIKECKHRLLVSENQDSISVNNRKIVANERALDHYLKNYSLMEQYELLKVIKSDNDNCVEDLETLGWTIKK